MKSNKDTLKILYWIMAVLGVISIIMEFDLIEKIIDLTIRDIEDLGPFSFILSIKAHLHQHGDFYKDIALGGLASAVISAVAVKVSISTLLKNISLSYTKAVRELAGAYGQVVDKIKNYENMGQLVGLESSNEYYINSIYIFSEMISKYEDEKFPSMPELAQLCKDALIPLAKSVNALIVSVKTYDNIYRERLHWKEKEFEAAWLKCMQEFYQILDAEYHFDQIDSVFLKHGFNLDRISGYYYDLINNLLKEGDEAIFRGKKLKFDQAIMKTFSNMTIQNFWETKEELSKMVEKIEKDLNSQTNGSEKSVTNSPTSISDITEKSSIGESIKMDVTPRMDKDRKKNVSLRSSKPVKRNLKRKQSKVKRMMLMCLKKIPISEAHIDN